LESQLDEASAENSALLKQKNGWQQRGLQQPTNGGTAKGNSAASSLLGGGGGGGSMADLAAATAMSQRFVQNWSGLFKSGLLFI
jgi:hypothetical protein